MAKAARKPHKGVPPAGASDPAALDASDLRTLAQEDGNGSAPAGPSPGSATERKINVLRKRKSSLLIGMGEDAAVVAGKVQERIGVQGAGRTF